MAQPTETGSGSSVVAHPAKIDCGFPECDYSAQHASEQVALAIFNSHVESHKVGASSSANKQKFLPLNVPY